MIATWAHTTPILKLKQVKVLLCVVIGSNWVVVAGDAWLTPNCSANGLSLQKAPQNVANKPPLSPPPPPVSLIPADSCTEACVAWTPFDDSGPKSKFNIRMNVLKIVVVYGKRNLCSIRI